ncbi:amidase [Bacillus sp. 31A1R]|uniref:Amidase n=1 Tax=Robertmurraya mangrovi TaxID=3098077 RepID=A0ABU5IVZ4_9BACI|nr:amidase [Bacillus sp. 31A1R]MDZ5471324.1 amidase [Bacillus sp. 31A1R]
MKEILKGSITQLATLYLKKEVSPVEVVQDLLDEIEKEDMKLNAFISLFENEARLAAKNAEEKFLKGEEVSILCGIPYSLKDLFYTKGLKTTCGSLILKDFIPDYDAFVVEKLQSTGAVLLGKTNMLEFAYGIVHPEYGQTNNPHDVSKTAGGSSGGSAAAVSAGLGFFSLGSDTGGSIRIPASYCGVAGLKPTYGAVSLRGVFPLSWSLDHAGPIARNIEDLSTVFQAIAGYDAKDPYSSLESGYGYSVVLDQVVIGILPDSYLRTVQSEVKIVYEKTLSWMEKSGWKLKEIELPSWNETEEYLMKILLPEAAHIHQHWLHRKEEYASQTFEQIDLGLKQKAVEYLDGLKKQKEFREEVSKVLEEVDALFMPTVAFPAPAEDPVIGDESLNEMTFTGPFNLSGHPAVTLNLGFFKEGLPIGMQLVGGYFEEEKLLQIASLVETCT